MKCVWTQKVSLLIDGELDRTEAREVEQHLDTCGDCQTARADFLSLRRQIAAYQIDLDAFAGQRALKRILAAGASGAKRETEGDGRTSLRRGGGRFAGVFGMPRLSPVGLAALLLLLVGIAIGIVSLTNARRPPSEVAHNVPTPAPSNDVRSNSNGGAQTAPPTTPKDSTAGTSGGGETVAGSEQKRADGELAKGSGAPIEAIRERAPRGSERAPRLENARHKVRKSLSSPSLKQPRVDVPVADTASNNVEAVDASDAGDDAAAIARRERDVTGDSKTARHVEQAQLLLRSFRNARPSEAGRRASSDLAYDKRQSKKLLYQNIVLRREAASRGNLPVESLLDSLEPILIDIANLPDKPAPEDVREINERMRRKNLVAMLQISSVESASTRSY
jgi:hypothetical protein